MKKLFLFLFIFYSQHLSAQGLLQQKVDSLAKMYLSKNSGAIAFGIFDNDREKIIYYGETEKGNHQSPDSNSIFELGNISETFTDILYADMSIKGIIGMDDKLQKFLPVDVPLTVFQGVTCRPVDKSSELVPSQNSQFGFITLQYTPYICTPDSGSVPHPILLCFLASHTSGFPEFPDNFNPKKNKGNPFAYYTKDMLYDYLRGYTPQKIAGSEYKHSELGIAILGHALSLKMKMSFDSLLIERILKPLNMVNSGIQFTNGQEKYLLKGHNERGEIVDHWTYDVMAPAGAMHSTAPDMMKFLSANISKKKNYFSDVLDYTHNPRIELTGSKSNEMKIALGWKVSPAGIESRNIVWQSGQTDGFSSYIGFIEPSHTGVFILSSVKTDVSEMGAEILRILEKEKLN